MHLKSHFAKSTAATLCACTLSCIAASAQFSKPGRQYAEWTVTTDKGNREYTTGQKAKASVCLTLAGVPADGLWIHYSVGDEMMTPDKHDSVLVRKGMATLDLGTRKEPGFRTCNFNFTADGHQHKDLLKVGFSIDKLAPLTPDPSDFDSFWAKTIEQARQVPLDPVLTPLPQHTTDKVAAYLVRLTVGKGDRHMYGFLSIPKDGKRHPVLFNPPGAGTSRRSFTDYYSLNGYVYLTIEIHGIDQLLGDEDYKAEAAKRKDYIHKGIASPETYYYRDVYAGCVRCVDYLCTLPEFDGVNVGVTGGSQGGALTITTAALSDKVTFCAAFYPALSDLLGFRTGRAGGWPKFFSGKPADGSANSDNDTAAQTLAYYDVANFAKRLKVPGFYNYGFNDETCSPTSVTATLNAIVAPKTILRTPTAGHWRFTEGNDKAMEWMKSMLK